MLTDVAQQASNFVHANGIDIHYTEAGQGVPLVLVHGGMVSSNPIWTHAPVAYAAHMPELAGRYRVIAPDTRGCGQTVHDGGEITFDRLADDLLALIDALGLDRPLLAGFSEGGITATIAGIKRPDGFRAIVNDAGYDMFNPAAPSFTMMRQMLGGNTDTLVPDNQQHSEPGRIDEFEPREVYYDRRSLLLEQTSRDGLERGMIDECELTADRNSRIVIIKFKSHVVPLK